MNRRTHFLGLILLFLLASCARISPPASPSPTPAPTLTATSTPTPAPTMTPTPTPVILTLTIKNDLVNCRNGPGVVYELINELKSGEQVRAIGRNDTSTWWYIRDPGKPGGRCWVSSEVSEMEGDASQLPVVGISASVVTDVNLRVDPLRIVVDCDQFPQTFFFEAEIHTNGPALVQWQWEASTGVKSDVGSIIFEEAGMKLLNEYYQVNTPNEYWVRLHILAPTEITEEIYFRALCN